MDNEAPQEFKDVMRANGCNVKLVPLDARRHNIAKHGIQNYKSHFIPIIAGVDDSFLIHQWDLLVPQIMLTLNLL